jgi:hypothetical protein
MFVELRFDCKFFVARATLNHVFFVVISNGVPFQFCQSVESFVALFTLVVSNLQVGTFDVHFEFGLGKKCERARRAFDFLIVSISMNSLIVTSQSSDTGKTHFANVAGCFLQFQMNGINMRFKVGRISKLCIAI